MFPSFVFRCLCFWQLVGVFADSGTVKSVSVMEGYPVTLQSGLTQIQENDLIYWYSEDSGILIAHINKEAGHFNISDGRLKDRLELDHQTGSLTIMNINIKDSGLYNVTIKRNNVTNHRFNVTVYARLPDPVISNMPLNCSSSSSSSSQQTCSLLCSVENVGHVTLSWYKGNSLLSNISVSDLSRNLSLEVNITDSNSYSCVVNNPIRNLTQHLDSSKLCQPCSALISAAAVGCVLVVAAVGVFWIYRRHRKTKVETDPPRNEEITYADPTFYNQKAKKPKVKQEEEVVYAGVVMQT
ncbi:transmembrane and immunoglobulin domain-containing protein 1-like isoform X2 [Puntigrus tetrazona]|uniref:transmembrane and immunoglobulin domain-containing protein 1-like isoform X2 n=1 Tax=Puntigrus tetrazona TaxID=1606681 RepID=UPI001C895F62|nr:transmembrane and immunoglobulin domain-containing protein 1-like isoform X2 [Puntigrus tetrazona]